MKTSATHCLRFSGCAAACALALITLMGCARFEPTRARHDQTAAFTNQLARLAEQDLARPVSLDDCVRIAMRNNYSIRKADLDKELARIGKNVAFTVFLPTITASAGYTTLEKASKMSKDQYWDANVGATMPIFMPSSWFLYAATKHGYAAAGVASAYVRQGIVLQTSVNYFNTLVQQETVSALETQWKAAREAADRIEGLTREGFFTRWEGDQAKFQAEAREVEWNRARRELNVIRGQLLQGMGLSPTAPITLSGETGPMKMPEGSVEDFVLKALEIHPELLLADRKVVIQEHKVRQAICNFIPTVSLFSTPSWTSNDLVFPSSNWATGFKGVWTLFDGFANVARYRASKVERKQSELQRESTFLSVIVQVMTAEAAVRDASEATRLREHAYAVAKAKFEDYDARSREGLIALSDALDARSMMDLAQVAWVRSKYQERIAVANLELAMGITAIPEDKPEERKAP